ncbi:unnamed protein product [Cylicostephanus goldi]|uniref:Transmembrane protein n=1 Tax=Cylicostephanus goldi TaxID=71465 RepID=A0A3P7M0N7_CYLGO|nr:unnamed protein product [Cylicostephanus goldi]
MDDDARAEWVLRILQFITAPIVIPALFLLRPYHMAVFTLFNRKKMFKKTTPLMTKRREEAPLAVRPLYPTNPTYPPTDPTFQTDPPQLLYPPATPSQLSKSAETDDSISA